MNRQFAVVTGASSGIGLELARQLAQQGYDVLITSSQSNLDAAAEAVTSAGGNVVAQVHADLATTQGVDQLFQQIKQTGRPVDVLALNAGVGMSGSFLDNRLEDMLRLIQLNAVSVVHLARLALPDMVARKSGNILITASIAAITPTPFETVYGPTKAFVKSFAETLHSEFEESGVNVTAFMPGPTETNFFHRAGMDDTKIGAGKKDPAAEVAHQALEAMVAGKSHAVTGSMKTKLQAAAMETVLPEQTKASMHRKEAAPGSATK